MAVKAKFKYMLWAASRGECAFEGCSERICIPEAEGVAPFLLGEVAHICGKNSGSNRYDAKQTDAMRDDLKNLILLCPNHHRLIDLKENESIYTVAKLRKMKAEHEKQVLQHSGQKSIKTKADAARELVPMLEENRQCWKQYGPGSELARKNPHNEAAHAVWVTERLSVIVPNNRKMKAVLDEYRTLFSVSEQACITTFLMHVRSYEKWVQEGGDYATVKRFPIEFDKLMRGLADGCT